MFLFNKFVLSSCLALCLTQDYDFYDSLTRNSSSTSENVTTSYEEANATFIMINTADLAQLVQKIADLENEIKTLTQKDGGRDCDDGSDEADRIECGRGLLTCGDGTCVDSRRVCDGHKDCSDGGDEAGCREHQCEDWQIKCVR